MPEEQIAARLQGVEEMLDKLTAALFGKIDKDVHAENHVHFAHINDVVQIHVNEIHHLAETGANFIAAIGLLEVGCELAFVDTGDAASRVNASFGGAKRVAADVGGQNFYAP